MNKKIITSVVVVVSLLVVGMGIMGFQYYRLNESYKQLLLKEGLTKFQYAAYQFNGGCIKEIVFSNSGNQRTIRADVTLQNSFGYTASPEYKIVLYDAFGLAVGTSTQNWIVSTLKPGEVRKQDFTFAYDGGVMPKYVRLYDSTRFER